MTLRNPWHHLPNSAPYVLPDDRPFVQMFNRSAAETTRIHTELLPEPFFGRFDAPIVVLLLNPGFSADDAAYHAQPKFRSRLRAAIRVRANSHHTFISTARLFGLAANGGCAQSGR